MSKYVLTVDVLKAIKLEMEEYVTCDPYTYPEVMFLSQSTVDIRRNQAKDIDGKISRIVELYTNYCNDSSEDNIEDIKSLYMDLYFGFGCITCSKEIKNLINYCADTEANEILRTRLNV